MLLYFLILGTVVINLTINLEIGSLNPPAGSGYSIIGRALNYCLEQICNKLVNAILVTAHNYKILCIHNLREINIFHSKLVSFILFATGTGKHTTLNKHTSLLRTPYITKL